MGQIHEDYIQPGCTSSACICLAAAYNEDTVIGRHQKACRCQGMEIKLLTHISKSLAADVMAALGRTVEISLLTEIATLLYGPNAVTTYPFYCVTTYPTNTY